MRERTGFPPQRAAHIPHPSWSLRSAEWSDDKAGISQENKLLRRRFVQEPQRLAELWGLLDGP